jgi:hypothetical protein
MLRLGIRAERTAAFCLIVMTMSSPAHSNETAEQVLREQQTVSVQGVKETWQLVWDGKPSTVCGPDEVYMAITCPCLGFAYGEYGKLLLVRRRGGRVVERMDLRPLFGKSDYPEADKLKGTAYLQRWPTEDRDLERENSEDRKLISDIKHRPAPLIMGLADYDRDGNATEFLIQVGTLPCGKLQFAAVGVSAKNPHLHALTTIANPGTPLIMPLNAWQALLKGPGPSTVPIWDCGDHGSDVRGDLVVSASDGKVSVKERHFSCSHDSPSAKPVTEEDL